MPLGAADWSQPFLDTRHLSQAVACWGGAAFCDAVGHTGFDNAQEAGDDPLFAKAAGCGVRPFEKLPIPRLIARMRIMQ
ncbi:hypothetical protein GCM10011363_09420 [Marivita lacus]|uniref:Uncharacterized protein n=1 Tax=Marivita lacus TaxID=1323742 RepID=A0ABQ1KFV2_9RHOB|nr:hypothetical protein GCM10011363_09420 [Marivita lacus]